MFLLQCSSDVIAGGLADSEQTLGDISDVSNSEVADNQRLHCWRFVSYLVGCMAHGIIDKECLIKHTA